MSQQPLYIYVYFYTNQMGYTLHDCSKRATASLDSPGSSAGIDFDCANSIGPARTLTLDQHLRLHSTLQNSNFPTFGSTYLRHLLFVFNFGSTERLQLQLFSISQLQNLWSGDMYLSTNLSWPILRGQSVTVELPCRGAEPHRPTPTDTRLNIFPNWRHIGLE